MDRRSFISGMAGGLLAAPLVAGAQPADKLPRIGLLLTPSPEHPIAQAVLDAFRLGLREHGYVAGQTIVIETRFAQERLERYRELLAELVSLKVNVIVVGSTGMALAAKQVHLSMQKMCQSHGGVWSQAQETCNLSPTEARQAAKQAKDICIENGGRVSSGRELPVRGSAVGPESWRRACARCRR